MSAAVLRRGLATGWRSLLITAAAVAAMLALGLAVYGHIDLSIYARLPGAARALLGIPPHAAPAILAYDEMLASVGALAFVGVAIAIGSQTVAGEERDRTLHGILAAPVSRVHYVISRAAAMILLLASCGALLWGVAELAPRVLGVAVGEAHIAALILHLTAAAAFHGALALCIGAATGRKTAAAGTATAVMVLGWLGSSLLPLWRKGSADWIPWTWFNGSTPLVNGVNAGQLALLLGGAVVLIGLGALGFRARELRLFQTSAPVLDRLRAMPRVGKILAPTGKGSSLLGLRLAAQQVLLAYVAFVMFAAGLAMPLIYKPLSSAMGGFAATFPPAIAALFGGGDLSTAAGFLHLEIFGMLAPAAVVLVAVAAAISGIAGEERARRMPLLLAQPLSRAKVYWTISAAVALDVVIVGAALFVGSWAGKAISGVDVSVAHLIVTCSLLVLFGWFFGALAVLCSAAAGRTTFAVWAPSGLAIATYFGYTLLLAAGKESWGWWSPFRAYLAGPPLSVGVTGWWQFAWLALGAVTLATAGLPFFRRRDLRITA